MIKLNKENIDKVIKIIRDENKFFDMGCHYQEKRNTNLDSYETFQLSSNYVSSCGTPGCICGWANHIRLTEDGDGVFRFHELSDFRFAAAWLGLSHEESMKLFYLASYDDDDYDDINLDNITRNHTIAVLENLKETGNVNWRVSRQ